MKGLIYINAYKIPSGNTLQAQRLKEEFALLGVQTEIVTDGWKNNFIQNNNLRESSSVDFVVFLDKDKYLSYALEKKGIRLFNSHNSIRACDDKAQTFLELANKGINMPNTIPAPLCYNKDAVLDYKDAEFIAQELGLPLIVKESFGSLGQGVYLANTVKELFDIMNMLKLTPHLYQQYISQSAGVDIRLIVIGGKVVCAMLRKNANDFRSNLALGGSGEPITPDKQFIDLAQRVANLLGLDYCGVDLLIGKNNTPYVCEVNSNAFISGIESVTKVNVARAYAEYIIKEIKG